MLTNPSSQIYLKLFLNILFWHKTSLLVLSQRIASGGDGKTLKFFGQSIHGEMDLNGDGLTDVTIGGLGGAALFWYVF